MVICEDSSLPVAIHIASASPHEITLAETTINARFTKHIPHLLIGDRAYDSDPHDAKLRKRRVQLIAPHRGNRKRIRTQDGRPLRRYRRRWKIERLNAWLQNNRRLVTRYERSPDNFLGFIQLACMKILLKRYF
jgi:transposase